MGSVTLAIIDLIGQPTWGGNDADGQGMSINFMTPLRADIFPYIDVTLPNTLQFVTKGSGYLYNQGYPRSLSSGDRERLTFNGPIRLNACDDLGRFAQSAGRKLGALCTGIPPRWGANKAYDTSRPLRTKDGRHAAVSVAAHGAGAWGWADEFYGRRCLQAGVSGHADLADRRAGVQPSRRLSAVRGADRSRSLSETRARST